MNRIGRSATSSGRLVLDLGRKGVSNVHSHWALAAFSFVAAFGVWFALQDVENPRVTGVAPVGENDPLVRVEAVNVPDGYLVVDLQSIQVRVEARERDLPQLRAGDFKATVNVSNIDPGSTVSRPVQVESRRDGVSVVGAIPASVQVTLKKAEVREVPVQINRTGVLPAGYEETDSPSVDPPFVEIRGLPELVASVKSVDVDVNLSGARDATVVLEGDLVARTQAGTGNAVAVALSQSRAKVTFRIKQTLAQRTVALSPSIVGSPAAGYLVANVSIEPPVVVVTGVKAFVDSLQQLTIEKLDVTGATRNITQTRQIERPSNVSTERQTVVVRVEIRPIDCGGSQPATPCGWASVALAPLFEFPLGLTAEPGVYIVQVRVSGPLATLATLKPSDFKATVSLIGGSAGTGLYPVTVVPPAGVKVEGVDALIVVLHPVPVP